MQNSQENSNVISLFGRQPAKVGNMDPEIPEESDFLNVMQKNKENEERMRRERARANKSVIRSHRLNNNKR